MVDLVPLYPASLYATPSSPLHFLQLLRNFYIKTYNDPFFVMSHDNQPSWYKLFTYLEVFYQLPMTLWMVYRFSRGTGTTVGFELAVLVFCVECALTTLTCIFDVSYWDPNLYSEAQKNVFIFNLYGPWVVIRKSLSLQFTCSILMSDPSHVDGIGHVPARSQPRKLRRQDQEDPVEQKWASGHFWLH